MLDTAHIGYKQKSVNKYKLHLRQPHLKNLLMLKSKINLVALYKRYFFKKENLLQHFVQRTEKLKV